MPLSANLPSEQAVFSKHLFIQGYPLWNPDPVLLPPDRQSVGLKIGDVGTVDERGRFNVLFNILEPLPDIPGDLKFRLDFPPIVEDDVHYLDQDISPLEVVSSPDTAWDVDVGPLLEMSIGGMRRQTTQYGATLSSDGAHVILPQGAHFFGLCSQDRKLFEKHARDHGAEWLEHFKDELGWPRSNSLYLLTGFYKSCSWSLASFGLKTAANTDPVHVCCTLVEVEGRLVQQDSVWEPAGRFMHKIGPAPDHQGRMNQTVFVRGIMVTPNSMVGQNQTDENAFSTMLSRLTDYMPLNTVIGSNNTRGTENRERDAAPLSQALHPSEVINRYLLNKEPSASIAVTDDSQWISMFETAGSERPWTIDELEHRIDSLVLEHCRIGVQNGIVYLVDQEHRLVAEEQSLSHDVTFSVNKSLGKQREVILADPVAESSSSVPMGDGSSVDNPYPWLHEPSIVNEDVVVDAWPDLSSVPRSLTTSVINWGDSLINSLSSYPEIDYGHSWYEGNYYHTDAPYYSPAGPSYTPTDPLFYTPVDPFFHTLVDPSSSSSSRPLLQTHGAPVHHDQSDPLGPGTSTLYGDNTAWANPDAGQHSLAFNPVATSSESNQDSAAGPSRQYPSSPERRRLLPLPADDAISKPQRPHGRSTASDAAGYSHNISNVPGRGPLIPQDRYLANRSSSYADSNQHQTITFNLERPDQTGIPIIDILTKNGSFDRVRDRAYVIDMEKKTFTLRVLWPGYRLWSKTIAAMDWRKSRGPITRVKLAESVATSIRDLFDKYRNEACEACYAEWKIGSPGGVQLDDVCLVALHHVSRGSWQPELCLIAPRS